MSDADVLRYAAVILQRRSKKPNGFVTRVFCKVLNNVAFDLDVEDRLV